MTNYLTLRSTITLQLNAINIAYSTVTGSSIVFTSSIAGSTINQNIMVSQFLNYSTLSGSTISATSITANTLRFSTLSGSTITTSTMLISTTTGTGSTFAITSGTSAVTQSATPQYPLDISETIRATTVEYTDGSDAITASPSLDYSQFGQNWTPVNQLPQASWQAVAVSASGQYQTAAGNGTGVYYSSNYGQSWSYTALGGNIMDLKASASGQYQILCISGSTIHYSSNYGQTWTASNAPNANWRSVCISASGQYASAGGASSANGPITSYYSSNYGQTWIASSFTGFNYAMACSASGQYQVNGQGQNGGVLGIYYSSNYGRTFTISSNTVSQACWFAAMSASGQYALVTQNAVSNISMYISNNYGRTFNSVTLGFMGFGCTMSASGQYQMVAAYSAGNGFGTGIYYSINYGQTWTLSPSTASLGGMYQVATSANGQYSLSCLVASGLLYQSITPFANTMASVNLLSQTLQPAALTFSDGSALTSASEPLDYSTFAVNWALSGSTSQNWFAPSISASGQYQINAVYNGAIHYSSNYGQTWTAVTNSPTLSWGRSAMSASGQYAIICPGNNNITTPGLTYISSTYGQTWSVTPISVNGCVAISATGQYMAICNIFWADANNSTNGIYISSNYGQSWTQTNTNQMYAICMSSTGQYLYASNYGAGSAYFSTNYGQTWGIIPGITPSSIGVQHIACSGSGQYVTITGNATGIYYSNNYAKTFIKSASFTTAQCMSVAMTATGQYQLAPLWGSSTIYYSTNYGVSWSSTAGPASIYLMALSANGQYLSGGSGAGPFGGGGIIYTSITRFPSLSLNNIPSPNALSSATNPGYTTLPGGIIMQFGNGRFICANNTSTPPNLLLFINFPKPFATACYGIQVSLDDLGTGTNYMQVYPSASFNATYFIFAIKGVQGQGTYTANYPGTYYYIAYGK